MTSNNHSSDNIAAQRIDPARIDLTRAGSGAGHTANGDHAPAKRRNGPPLLAIAGTLLLLLAAGVIFWLPSRIEPPTAAAPNTPPSQPVVSESPYQQAQLAQARRDAQGLLADILAAQQQLEERAVERWAAQVYENARQLATEGDNLYRQGRFEQALDNYRRALDAHRQLLEQWPQALANQLASGDRALEAGDQQAARAAFETALAIDPDNEQAGAGLKRSEVLDRTHPLLQAAEQQFSADEVDTARKTLEQLLALDPAHPRAKTLLKEVDNAIAQRRFNDHMSRGLMALNTGNATTAIGHFEQALQLKPDSSDARASLQQARNRRQATVTDRTLARAAELEANEQWHQAADLYRQVRDSDDTVVAARVGLLRSEARAELDDRIQAIVEDPLRLAATSVMTEARQLLADARAIDAPGPRLEHQATELARAIAQARVPVTVNLRSDSNTSVTLLRVGEMGQFDNKQIQLRPGRYQALGSRQGYRDVRVSFEVQPGDTTDVVVICTEPVS